MCQSHHVEMRGSIEVCCLQEVPLSTKEKTGERPPEVVGLGVTVYVRGKRRSRVGAVMSYW